MFRVGDKVTASFMGSVVGEVVYIHDKRKEIVVNWNDDNGVLVHSAADKDLYLYNSKASSGFINIFQMQTGDKGFYAGSEIHPDRAESIKNAKLIRVENAYVDTIEINWIHR